MSQDIFNDINPSTTSGTQLATLLNNFKAALMTGLSGVSRPAALGAGGMWIDTSEEASPDFKWYLKIYDGTDDIILFTLNLQTGAPSISGTDSEFIITKVSADTNGPVLSLKKSRATGDEQVDSGDYLGSVNFSGADNTAAFQIGAKIRARALASFLSTEAGTEIVFEQVIAGNIALTQVMTIYNGKLGIGIAAPTSDLHVVGNNGINFQRSSDNALGTTLALSKRRATGTGQVLASDVLGLLAFYGMDNTSTSEATALIQAMASQNHVSGSAKGTELSIQTINLGATALTEKIKISDYVQFFQAISLYESVDSSTTGAAASATISRGIHKFTNASLTSLNNLVMNSHGLAILINGLSTDITVTNNSGGTAANRILTGTGADLRWAAGSSLLVAYDADSSRVRVIGGTGAGGGTTSGSRQTGTSMSASTALTPTAGQDATFFVAGSGGPVTITASPPVTTSGMVVGQRATIWGTSDANPVTYENGNNLVLMKGSAELGKDRCIELQYLGTDGSNAAWAETGRNF